MLFGKEVAFLYVHKNGITFYVDRETFGLQFDFPKDSINGLQVINGEQIQAALATFLKENYGSTTYSVTMLLSEEVTADKTLVGKEKVKQQEEVNEFVSSLSFKNAAKIVYKKDSDIETVAANRDLFGTLRKLLAQYGWKTESVVALHLFDELADSDVLTEYDLEQIHKKSNYLKEGDFLHEEPEEEVKQDNMFLVPSEQKRPFYRHKTLWLGLILLLLMAGGGYGAISHPELKQQLLNKLHPTKTVVTVVPTKAVIKSPTPTQTKQVAKSDLKIQVLNGTGTAGQAGTVKSDLAKLGYTNVTTDNASSTNNTDATVSYAATVPQPMQAEITKELQSLFVHVTVSTSAPTSGYDVKVITGLQK